MRLALRKLTFRTLVGLAFLYPASLMHHAAHSLADLATGVRRHEETAEDWAKRERQRHMTDIEKRDARRADAKRQESISRYFVEDPREVMNRPENQKTLKQAIELDQIAVTTAALGAALIGWGLLAAIGTFVLALLQKRDPNPKHA